AGGFDTRVRRRTVVRVAAVAVIDTELHRAVALRELLRDLLERLELRAVLSPGVPVVADVLDESLAVQTELVPAGVGWRNSHAVLRVGARTTGNRRDARERPTHPG